LVYFVFRQQSAHRTGLVVGSSGCLINGVPQSVHGTYTRMGFHLLFSEVNVYRHSGRRPCDRLRLQWTQAAAGQLAHGWAARLRDRRYLRHSSTSRECGEYLSPGSRQAVNGQYQDFGMGNRDWVDVIGQLQILIAQRRGTARL